VAQLIPSHLLNYLINFGFFTKSVITPSKPEQNQIKMVLFTAPPLAGYHRALFTQYNPFLNFVNAVSNHSAKRVKRPVPFFPLLENDNKVELLFCLD